MPSKYPFPDETPLGNPSEKALKCGTTKTHLLTQRGLKEPQEYFPRFFGSGR
jgi:hypothetical protein